MSHTPAGWCVHKSVCTPGHGYVCILINTLLTPRPGNINHKTMENGARGGGATAGSKYSIVVYVPRQARCIYPVVHNSSPMPSWNLFNSSFSSAKYVFVKCSRAGCSPINESAF